MLSAIIDHDLIDSVFEPVVTCEFATDGFLKLDDTRARCGIFGEALRDSADASILDILRGIKIRFARRQSNDIAAIGPHRCGLGRNLHRHRRLHALNIVGKWHGILLR